MATDYYWPTVDVNSNWDTPTVTLIDEQVTQPTAGSGDFVIADPNNDFGRQVYGTFKNASGDAPSVDFTTITSIKVWCYCKDDGGGDTTLDVDIEIDAVVETPQQFTYTGSLVWYSKEFTGSWSASDVDAMEVGLTTGSNPDLNLDVLYVEINDDAAGASLPLLSAIYEEEAAMFNNGGIS